jgi:sec-independent protein translocase protein TatA
MLDVFYHPPIMFFEGLFAPQHLLVIGLIAILVFGKRLPEIARSLGKSMVEFKKGLKGLEDEIQSSTSAPSHQDPVALQPPPRPPQRVQSTAPKFEDNAGAVSTPPQAQP